MSNRISKIRVKGVDYEVRSKRGSATKTINSLSSIPVDVESIVANISSSTSFSLASNMNKGDHIDLLCIPSSDFQQEISGDNIKTAFDGKISVKNGQPFKLYINCYDTNKIFIDASNVEIVPSAHTVTFNITPSDATVNYSIDSQTYNQTTTGTGTVSNVPHGSTIYYKISKGGYETITKSQVVNSDVTVTESMKISINEVIFTVSGSDSGTDPIFKLRDQYGELNDSTLKIGQNVIDAPYGFITPESYLYDNYVSNINLTGYNFDLISNMDNMFQFVNLSQINYDKLQSINTSNVRSLKYTFQESTSGEGGIDKINEFINYLNLDNSNNLTDLTGMFSTYVDKNTYNDDIKIITLKFNTHNVTSMAGMFENTMFGDNIKELILDISSFTTDKLISTSHMFYMSSITTIYMDNFELGSHPETTYFKIFDECNIKKIRCKQAFKNWCIENASIVDTVYNDIGYINWEIVD